jgi:peroxiredoxin
MAMSNSLTGDFDVVAQFGVPAVNRLLATMHRTERFPHSIAAKVDDHQKQIVVGGELSPTLVAVMDSNGDAVTNHQHLGLPLAVIGPSSADTAAFLTLDPVVNVGDLVLEETPLVPSNLQGRVQFQVFPPTIDIPDSSGTNVTVHLEMIARYFPDPNTSPMTEFVRGFLRLTAPVTQVASQHARVVEIDIKGASIGIDFTPTWSSRQLVAEDLMAINQVIRNSLRTSFLPSSSTLPSSIAHMQFKTMRAGAQHAVAILLNTTGAAGNRATATNLFLNGSDFAFGVGVDYVKRALQPTLDKILTTPIDPISFTIDSLVHTWHITYTLTLNSATIELEDGEIVLTFKGHASTPSWPPNFDFTVRAPFTLSPSGDTADLVAGDISLDTSSWVINRFKDRATSGIRNVRDHALSQSGALSTVRKMLSAEGNLGSFIDSLLQPPRVNNAPPLPKGFFLSYSSIQISPDGIALRGSMAVSPWPAPHVEFEQIPMNGGGRFDGGLNEAGQGPDYSALKTWIPGGVISRYEWKPLGQTQQGFSDANRFVLLHQGPVVAAASAVNAAAPVALSGYRPMCVTVHGTRLSSSGPVTTQNVQASICGIHIFPFPGEFGVDEAGTLSVAMVQPGSNGLVEVAGHTAAMSAGRGRMAPNLIVHFGDHDVAKNLEIIEGALRESRRTDASTAILAIVPSDELSKARFNDGVTYSDDKEGGWARRYGAAAVRHPFTLIVTPDGKTAWKHEGPLDSAKLTEAIRDSVVRTGKVRPALNPSSVRIGQIPPNFLFEYADRREITLRKMKGQQIVVVFWRSSSKESVEQIRRLEKLSDGGKRFVVLAVNDGESEDVVRGLAKVHTLSAVVVPDPKRHVSLAYGVNAWPTTVWIDELGITRSIQIGDFGGAAAESPFKQPDREADNETVEQKEARS